MISIFLNLPRLVSWPRIWSVLENIPCTLQKNMYSAALGWNILHLSLNPIWTTCFILGQCFLINFLSGWWCKWDVKFPCYYCSTGYSSFMVVNVCFMYLGTPMLGTYFSISNNRASDKPHWLWYCHCAKLGTYFS